MGLEEGTLIKKRRKLKGLTQKEVCERLGLSTAPIHQVENGLESISLSNLRSICDQLGLKIIIVDKNAKTVA
jgi:transcriptional regulator with XRE-family HTH domain